MVLRFPFAAWILFGTLVLASETESPPIERGNKDAVFTDLLENTQKLLNTRFGNLEAVNQDLKAIGFRT
jgi:hypothetical protein